MFLVMALIGRADLSRSDEPQIYGGLYDVTGHLGRSVTIALIASPAGLLLISVTRLLIISNYDPTTASAIVASGGYIDTLLGTTIPLIPIFLPYVALVLFFFNRVILGILALLTAVLISPAALTRTSILRLVQRDWNRIIDASAPIQALMIATAIALTCLLLVELFRFNDFFKTVAVLVSIIAIPIVVRVYPFPIGNQFYSELIRQPWLPADTITLRSGQEFTGYILSDEPSRVVVLSETTRTVIYFPPSDVVGVHLCQMGQASSARPLVTLIPAGTPRSPRTSPCQPASVVPATSRSNSPMRPAASPVRNGPQVGHADVVPSPATDPPTPSPAASPPAPSRAASQAGRRRAG